MLDWVCLACSMDSSRRRFQCSKASDTSPVVVVMCMSCQSVKSMHRLERGTRAAPLIPPSQARESSTYTHTTCSIPSSTHPHTSTYNTQYIIHSTSPQPPFRPSLLAQSMPPSPSSLPPAFLQHRHHHIPRQHLKQRGGGPLRLLPLALTAFTTFFGSFSSKASGGPGAGRGEVTARGVSAASMPHAAASSSSSSDAPTPTSTCLNHAAAAADLDMFKRLIPPLTNTARKGQMGRIGILGGSQDFTGAPFYAGMASLKVGGDLCYIFTAEEAAGPIKGYSPELMVTPVYSAKALGVGRRSGATEGGGGGGGGGSTVSRLFNRTISSGSSQKEEEGEEALVAHLVEQVTSFFPKLHVLVVGPGLGRDPLVMEATRRILLQAKHQALPLVIDADGLWLVAHAPDVLHDYPSAGGGGAAAGGGGGGVVVTPNLIEFARLQAGLKGASVADALPSREAPQPKDVMAVARALGGERGRVTVCLKGKDDIVADGERWLVVGEEGARRRSGGLGDVLAGTMGVLMHWSGLALKAQGGGGGEGGGGMTCNSSSSRLEARDSVLWACAAASVIARRASREAFKEKRRSMTAPDAIGTWGWWGRGDGGWEGGVGGREGRREERTMQ